jgi:hypothetical protein
MKDLVFEFWVGYSNSQTAKYDWIYFESYKDAKNYVAKKYDNKSLFNINTDGKTTFLINPKF